jgi:hypothetical protein
MATKPATRSSRRRLHIESEAEAVDDSEQEEAIRSEDSDDRDFFDDAGVEDEEGLHNQLDQLLISQEAQHKRAPKKKQALKRSTAAARAANSKHSQVPPSPPQVQPQAPPPPPQVQPPQDDEALAPPRRGRITNKEKVHDEHYHSISKTDFSNIWMSLARTLHIMTSVYGKYIPASNFLATGYPLDRARAEELWSILNDPASATKAQLCNAIFINNDSQLQPVLDVPLDQQPANCPFPNINDVDFEGDPYPDKMVWADYVQQNREMSPHAHNYDEYEPADAEIWAPILQIAIDNFQI